MGYWNDRGLWGLREWGLDLRSLDRATLVGDQVQSMALGGDSAAQGTRSLETREMQSSEARVKDVHLHGHAVRGRGKAGVEGAL